MGIDGGGPARELFRLVRNERKKWFVDLKMPCYQFAVPLPCRFALVNNIAKHKYCDI